MSVSQFGLGYKLLKKLCEEQNTLKWHRSKLVPEMFKPGEREVLALVNSHVQKHHALPQLDTIAGLFPDILQYPTPEPGSYYLEHVENRLYHEVINTANIQSQQILKDNQADHVKATETLSAALSYIAGHRYRQRIVNVAKEGPGLVMEAYHSALTQESAGTFGWPHMDNTSGGLMPGDVVSIIGRPAAGKTWLILRGAIHNWKTGHRPLVVSMEMSPLPLVQRIAAMYAHTNISQLKSGGYGSATYKKFASSMAQMTMGPNGFYVVDGNLAASVEDMYVLAAQLGCDQLWVDGAYLAKHPNKRLDKYTRVAENIELMKQRTTDLEMPTIASYQFARTAKKEKKVGSTEEAGLEDIAFSDAIGQISSIVLGLFQEESVETLEARKVRVLKGRNGEIGSFPINWDFNTLNFDQQGTESLEVDANSQLEYI